MATSRPIGKGKSLSAAQSPDHPNGPGRRTPRSSVPSSPEHHLQAPRKPIVKSNGDVSKTSKSQQPTPSANAAVKRQPIRKPAEKPPGLRGTATQTTTLKERAPRTTPATSTRPAISAKPAVGKASASKVATKTTRTQPALKTRTAGSLTKKKEATSSTAALKVKEPEPIVSESENEEASPNIVDSNSPLKDDLPDEQLDDIDELNVLEVDDDTSYEQLEQISTNLELEQEHEQEEGSVVADEYLGPDDEEDGSIVAEGEPNPEDESDVKEEHVDKELSADATEAAEEEITDEQKSQLEDNSEVAEHIEEKPSTETAEPTEEIVNVETAEEAAATEETAKKSEVVQGMRTETPKSNEVIEETRNKLMEHRNSKVKALAAAFETVMH